MKEREEWARQQEDQYRMRMDALREQRKSPYGEQKELPREVKEMVDSINIAINEARPGWLERLQKAQRASYFKFSLSDRLFSSFRLQMKAESESRRARQRV